MPVRLSGEVFVACAAKLAICRPMPTRLCPFLVEPTYRSGGVRTARRHMRRAVSERLLASLDCRAAFGGSQRRGKGTIEHAPQPFFVFARSAATKQSRAVGHRRLRQDCADSTAKGQSLGTVWRLDRSAADRRNAGRCCVPVALRKQEPTRPAPNAKKPPGGAASWLEMVVAGVGFEPTTFRL